MMYRSYADTGGNVNEEIKLLNSISHVSARLARNLRVLAASQSEEGGKEHVKDTDTIFNTLYSYSARIGSGGKPKEYYNL